MLGAKKPLTLDLHGQVEHPGKDPTRAIRLWYLNRPGFAGGHFGCIHAAMA